MAGKGKFRRYNCDIKFIKNIHIKIIVSLFISKKLIQYYGYQNKIIILLEKIKHVRVQTNKFNKCHSNITHAQNYL